LQSEISISHIAIARKKNRQTPGSGRFFAAFCGVFARNFGCFFGDFRAGFWAETLCFQLFTGFVRAISGVGGE
jgi:hypothetical protein